MRPAPFCSTFPIVRRQILDLARLGSLSGVGPSQWIRFEQPVVWLREASSQVVFEHGGHVLETGASYVDSGGYLTSLYSAIESAKHECEVYGVSAHSILIVRVVLSIIDIPVVACPTPPNAFRAGNYFYKAESEEGTWFHFADADMRAVAEAKSSSERDTAWQELSRLTSVEVEVPDGLWSSRGDAPGYSDTYRADQYVHHQRNIVQALIAGAEVGALRAG
ncbi:hypothetical protein PVE_R2G0664 [Pseudomonas veronii 1YdBTEX2]|uniref:Uncharacterized protein n=1 Tax=Pseudomonas veronii 1YdBTEX2 TaxID=1295141 RepID=A0A1D3K8Q5_PSEVE|nr:hypothetical protein PVE_R2G0664 [Pseudomonas veronii 1YdBTEX2]